MISRDEILDRKIKSLFEDAAHQVVIRDLLDTYAESHQSRETERVQLAVLKLAGSAADVGEVERYIECAKQDYRDVLALAEYPRQMEANYSLDESEMKVLIAKAREEYENWLAI